MARLLAVVLFLIPASLLAAPAGVNTPAAKLGPEYSFPSSAPVSAYGTQREPSVASDGNSFFAVWSDNRSGDATSAIYGTRITATGEVLDPAGILIGEEVRETRGQGTASIIWAKTHYVVFWTETYYAIKARRIAADGHFIDAVPIALSSYGRNVRAASAGTMILAAGLDDDHVILLDRDLREVKRIPVPIRQELWIAVGSNGNEFLLLTPGERSTTVSRISQGGEVIESRQTTLTTLQYGAVVAWTGNDYLMLWSGPTSTTRFDPRTGYTLYATRISREGVVLPGTVELRQEDEAIQGYSIASAGDGTAMVLYVRGRMTYAQLIGATLGEPTLLGEGIDLYMRRVNAVVPAPAIGGYVALWHGDPFVVLRVAALDGRGSNMKSSDPVSFSSPEQRGVAASRTPSNWTAWMETDAVEQRQIHIGRIGTGERIALTSNGLVKSPAAVAEGNRTVGVTWYEALSYVGPTTLQVFLWSGRGTGKRLGLDAFLNRWIIETDLAPAITWNGHVYLIAWRSSQTTLSVATVSEDGLVTPVLEQSALPQSEALHPQFATNGAQTLLVWQDGYTPFPCTAICIPLKQAEIFGRRFDTTGQPIESVPFRISEGGSRPSVAWNAGQFLVAWTDRYTILATRISATGFVMDTVPLQVGAGDHSAAGKEGSDFVIAWLRPANEMQPVGGACEVAVVRITPGGIVTEAGFVARGAALDYFPEFRTNPPAIASTSGGTFILYQRIAYENEAMPRLFYRRIGDVSNPRRRSSRSIAF